MGARLYLERVVLGVERGVFARIVRAVLWPLSIVYSVGLWVYLLPYRTGLRKKRRLRVPVVSVGNLTFGGTGKTPAVETLCRIIQAGGRKPAIISRGHGGRARGCIVVSDGESLMCGSDEAGDEPVQLARSLPGVPVVVGRDRRAAGDLVCTRFRPDLVVLDDGMQYWQLERDLEIAVLDARRPFGSGLVMPAGDLREPAGGLGRADILLVNVSSGLDQKAYNSLVSRLSRIAPRATIFRCRREPVDVVTAGGNESIGLHRIRRLRVFAFCGIGDPNAFVDSLESLGVDLVGAMGFPDHHRYSQSDIERIRRESNDAAAQIVITTEKDVARLGGRVSEIPELCILKVKLEIEEVGRFAQYVSERTNRTHSAASA